MMMKKNSFFHHQFIWCMKVKTSQGDLFELLACLTDTLKCNDIQFTVK